MKPSDLKKVVEKLEALGFKTTIRMGGVDRKSRPTTVKLDVKIRALSIEERDAFAE